MNLNTWINLFQFVKEIAKHSSLSTVRKRENRARNLHTLAFLGMFIFAMIMTEQAVVYSTAKHNETVELKRVQSDLTQCLATMPYFTANQEGLPNAPTN